MVFKKKARSYNKNLALIKKRVFLHLMLVLASIRENLCQNVAVINNLHNHFFRYRMKD